MKTLIAVLLVAALSAYSGEVLYNGIELPAPWPPAAPVMRTRLGAAISWREKEEGERKKGAGKTKGVKKKMKSLLCFLGRSTKNTVDDSLSFFFRFARSLSLSLSLFTPSRPRLSAASRDETPGGSDAAH